MSEYNPEFDWITPIPNLKPPKDHKVQEAAISSVLSLAMFGATRQAELDGEELTKAIGDCIQLFKDAGFLK